jgi:hypothetical protein
VARCSGGKGCACAISVDVRFFFLPLMIFVNTSPYDDERGICHLFLGVGFSFPFLIGVGYGGLYFFLD